MDEGGEDNPLSETLDLSVTQLAHTQEPSGEAIWAEGQLEPHGVVESEVELTAPVARDSTQGGTKPK